MKVACIQLSTGENYQLNFSQNLKLIRKAIRNKADLIVTPEVSSIMTSDKNILFKYSYSMTKDPFLKVVKQLSRKFKKWIIIGSISVLEKNKLRNRSIVINSKGKIETYYDKINMFDVTVSAKEKYFESKTFTKGNKLKIMKLPWGNLGLTICYDIRFPEMFRKLSKKNIKFISIPSAFTKNTGKKHWVTLIKSRAIENFCYIFAPNQVGRNYGKRHTYGHSAIISPDGKILSLKKKGVGIIYSKIDTKLPFKLRKLIPSV